MKTREIKARLAKVIGYTNIAEAMSKTVEELTMEAEFLDNLVVDNNGNAVVVEVTNAAEEIVEAKKPMDIRTKKYLGLCGQRDFTLKYVNGQFIKANGLFVELTIPNPDTGRGFIRIVDIPNWAVRPVVKKKTQTYSYKNWKGDDISVEVTKKVGDFGEVSSTGKFYGYFNIDLLKYEKGLKMFCNGENVPCSVSALGIIRSYSQLLGYFTHACKF